MSIIPTKTVEFVEIWKGDFFKKFTKGKDRGRQMCGGALFFKGGAPLLEKKFLQNDAGSDGGKTEAPGGGEA